MATLTTTKQAKTTTANTGWNAKTMTKKSSLATRRFAGAAAENTTKPDTQNARVLDHDAERLNSGAMRGFIAQRPLE